MGTEERPGPPDLSRLEALMEAPQGYHIFQALRLIEAAHPDKPRLGEGARPADDPIRIAQEVELAFPATTIREIEPARGKRPPRLISRFFGMFGPHGPLPTSLTEYVRDRQRNHRDHTSADFINMFSHRMMSLLYRAWTSAEPAPSFDRETSDRFSEKVEAIAGYRGVSFGDSDLMPDMTKRHFAAHLATGTRSCEGLSAILGAFFEAPVEVEDFVGSWLELEDGDRWELGKGGGLGRDTSIGVRVWTRSAKFRIRVGPVPIETYRRMLPGSPSLDRMQAIVRNYAGDGLDWELNLILRAEDVPQAELGTTALGFTGWTGERDRTKDADELHITPAYEVA